MPYSPIFALRFNTLSSADQNRPDATSGMMAFAGAMQSGIVEQAKGNAFRRDLAAGGTPTGLTRQDLDQAVLAVVAQNRGLNHTGVLQEIAAREGFSVASVIAEGAQPPRYTVDENDQVVRMQ